ncbi:HNH endonuclease family protein [Kineosporia babensis]|uniref:HNH endonuclease family protein n=1 Tax=Kineosporia babensis TaxID=499548 RepID=A0A9X1SW96_9ACTN|nr:HNH endonuclease family protein [Kineosporia babensis]MCD5314499.1 HNH endonuclease family protein [Kineosporia babensis]
MHRRASVVLGLAAVLLASSIGTGPARASAEPQALQTAAARTTTGKALLGKLKVQPEHRGDYQRAKFGEEWRDVDRDCQDTRSEVMQRDSKVRVTFYSARKCAVRTGKWTSPYDGRTWTDAQKLEIDHVVALSEAWKSGAAKWKKGKRLNYANDLGYVWTLKPVTRSVNQDKGDQDPAEWLPAKNRCTYARQWVAIKYRWGLSIDTAEKRALTKLLAGDCGRLKMKLPARGK